MNEPEQKNSGMTSQAPTRAPLSGAFFWLGAFYVVYCARPEDWIPGVQYIPLAKITGIFALLGLMSSIGKPGGRRLKDLPRESFYLLAMIGVLFLSAIFSTIWRGGALKYTLDFAKVYLAWVLTFLLVTNFERLRRIIYIQTASVVVISVVSVIKGHSRPRLEGVIGGLYSNPNDLAFAVVLTMPFCLAFLLTSKSAMAKLAWVGGLLVMALTVFLTASRGGFITLVISGAVCLWHFGVRGRRLALIVSSVFAVLMIMAVAGGPLLQRMGAIGGQADTREENRAYESYEQRKFLMRRAVQGIAEHPILGIGVRNFEVYSTVWRDVHMTYLQIAVEGGIPSLILYLLFFGRGFSNLRGLLRRKNLDARTTLFVGGLHSSMIGFVVGALFSPEAYEFFPYFAVAYTSALVATLREQDAPSDQGRGQTGLYRYSVFDKRAPDAVTIPR